MFIFFQSLLGKNNLALTTYRPRYLTIVSMPDTVTNQEAERKKRFNKNSLTAALFFSYKSK
jgi:hypothetical protein